MKKLPYILLTALLLCSCLKEYPQRQANGSVSVTFTVTLPDQIVERTRAAYSDTDIENIDLLLFDQADKYIGRVRVDVVEGAGSQKSFTARVDASTTPRTIHIVANGRTPQGVDRIDFDVLTLDMPESTAIPLLATKQTTSISEATILPLVMWGRTTVSAITSNMTVSGVELLRSQAVVQVRKATGVSNSLDDFEIIGATLHSVSSAGKVAPIDYTAPGTPTTLNEAPGPRIDYYDANAYIATGTTPVLYLYERDNTAADFLALIIHGSWKGTPGYYKVLLQDQNGVPMDVIRNHRYNVTVVEAAGTGHATIVEAVNSSGTNIRVEIEDAHDDIYFMYADGTKELGVSSNVLRVYGAPPSWGLDVDIATVFTSDSMAGYTNAVPALTDLYWIGPMANGTYLLSSSWYSGFGDGNSFITLHYGDLRHRIDVIYEEVTPWMQGEQNAVYMQLLSPSVAPWTAQIVRGENDTRLYHSGDPIKYNGGTDFGYTRLGSDASPAGLWVFSHTGSKQDNSAAVIEITYMEAGNFKKGTVYIYNP